MIARLATRTGGAAARWGPRPARKLRRTRPEPVLVRLGAFAAGVVALLVAMPASLPPVLVAGLVALAALPAVWPRGPWATVVVLAAAAAWLASTGLANLPDRTTPADLPAGRLVALLAALYLLHSLTALAATLPYDAVVVPDVLVRWLLRTLGVILVAVLVGAALLAGLTSLVDATGGRAYLAATLAGLVAGVVLVMVLTRHRRR